MTLEAAKPSNYTRQTKHERLILWITITEIKATMHTFVNTLNEIMPHAIESQTEARRRKHEVLKK